MFTRSGSTWTQQGEELVGESGDFGKSVALSPDGSVALVGGPFEKTDGTVRVLRV